MTARVEQSDIFDGDPNELMTVFRKNNVEFNLHGTYALRHYEKGDEPAIYVSVKDERSKQTIGFHLNKQEIEELMWSFVNEFDMIEAARAGNFDPKNFLK